MKNFDLYLWALEWSHRENVFRIQLLDDSLSSNRQLYRENIECKNDYRILVVGTKQECDSAAEAARYTLQAREGQYGPKE